MKIPTAHLEASTELRSGYGMEITEEETQETMKVMNDLGHQAQEFAFLF